MAKPDSDRPRRRRGFPLGLVGALILIALVAAYLSDCLPGLGAGGGLGTPSSEAPTTPGRPSGGPAEGEAAIEGKAAGDRITIVVRGEQCHRGAAEPQPCPQLCAALDRTHAATVEVDIEAVVGRHGTVEALRQCLKEAGFARVRVLAE